MNAEPTKLLLINDGSKALRVNRVYLRPGERATFTTDQGRKLKLAAARREERKPRA